eukprot:PITA_01020
MDRKEYNVQAPPPAPMDLIFSFAPALALKSAVLLKIPDIIATAGPDPDSSLSLRQIAARLPTQTPHLDYLSRILRYLSTVGIFIESQISSDPLDFHYGLTHTAKCYFLSDHNENKPCSMVPLLLMQTHEKLMAPWHHFHECVLQGEGCEGAFTKAHGKDVWAYCMDDPDLNTVINNAMASFTNIVMIPFLSVYEGFKSGEKLTVVDVGGGEGAAIAQIVKAYPHINGINFDLPHVIATARPISGKVSCVDLCYISLNSLVEYYVGLCYILFLIGLDVQHVGGDMFHSVPSGDVIFMKHGLIFGGCLNGQQILHDWDDERCAKILENCHRALPENGRLVVLEIVVSQHDQNRSQHVEMVASLTMLAHTNGRERNEQQWRRLFESSGFSTLKMVGLLGNTHFSVLEATKAKIH